MCPAEAAIWKPKPTVVPCPSRSGFKLAYKRTDRVASAVLGRQAQRRIAASRLRALRTVMTSLVREAASCLDGDGVGTAVEHAIQSRVSMGVRVATRAAGGF